MATFLPLNAFILSTNHHRPSPGCTEFEPPFDDDDKNKKPSPLTGACHSARVTTTINGRKTKKMRASRKAPTGESCDICGDVGWQEHIATCYLCKSAREHIYCMKFILCARPLFWICEECRSIKVQVFPKLTSTKISRDDISRSCGNRRVRLSSLSDLHSNPDCKTDTRATKSINLPKVETSLSKFNGQKLNADSGGRAVSDCNHLVIRTEEITQQQQVPQISKESQGNNWLVCKEEPVETLLALDTRVKTAAGSAPSSSIDVLPIISSCDFLFADVQSRSFTLQTSNGDPPDEPHKSFSLTSIAIWCGSFEMRSSDTCRKIYDGFQAYLPCAVHRKVLAFSKQMPGVISCSSVPYFYISQEAFQNDTPNIDDVALIFCPGFFQRSKEQYESLLELLEMRDLALKSHINSVELLIFSSKRLQEDFSGFKLGYFLCGVYRDVQGPPPPPPFSATI